MNLTNVTKFVGDYTYGDIVRLKPFGWSLQKEPIISHFNFEVHDPFYWHEFIERNYNLGFYVGFVYVLSIVGLKRWMQNRPAYDLKTPLILWNFTWGLFSFVALTRATPSFLHTLNQQGFYSTICGKEGFDIVSMYWGLLFIASKFVQLGDTHFILLRKRPLAFLQWWHHLSTMVVVWNLAPTMEPLYRWYAVFNGFSHSIMYPYLALKLMDVRMPSIVGKGITTIQLFEMLVGLYVNVLTAYLQNSGHECNRYPESINSFMLLYGSFLILFAKLFYESVLKTKTKAKIL